MTSLSPQELAALSLSPQDLTALSPEYLAEINPARKHVLNIAIAFIAINSILFTLFITAMRMTRDKSSIELYLIMSLGYLSVLGNSISMILMVTIAGVGRHFAYLIQYDPSAMKTFLRLGSGQEIIYMFSIVFPKIAILTLYLRVLNDRLARALTWATIATLLLFFLAGVTVSFSICRPYAFKWDKTINGYCGDIMAGYRAVSIPSIVTDLLILIIPIPPIWRLQLNRGKKTGVFLTFLIGSLGIVTAIIRCITYWRSEMMADLTFSSCRTFISFIVESSAYFCCACMIRLRPVLIWFLNKTAIGNIVTSTFQGFFNDIEGTRTSTSNDFRKVAAGVQRGSNLNSGDDDSKLVKPNVLPLDSIDRLERNI